LGGVPLSVPAVGRLTRDGGVQVLPLAVVVSQPVARVLPLTGEGGAGDDERPLGQDPLQGAATRAEDFRKRAKKYTLPFKSLGSLRNVFIFQRKALFFQ